MIIGIYAVHDAATKAFAAPFFMQHDDAAIRAFKFAVNDKQNAIAMSPGDYTLHKIGYWDDNTGVVTPGASQLAQGLALVAAAPSVQDLVGIAGGSAEKPPVNNGKGAF